MVFKPRTSMSILGKKYTYGILKTLEKGPVRFRDASSDCPSDKMKAYRLAEMEAAKIINMKHEMVGRKSVPFYTLSEKGKKLLNIAEELKDIDLGKA
jgi:DNA-binding HxlR family transcriptional regulator